MKPLTKTEEKIMHIFWEIEKGFVNDIIAQLPDPKPPYSTVSSVVRILEKKGFLSIKKYGNTYEYSSNFTKNEYNKFFIDEFIETNFNGSLRDMVAWYAKLVDTDITETEGMSILYWK